MEDFVRMKISRSLHSKFKRVSATGNNDRMAKLLADSEEKYNLVNEVYELKSKNNLERSRTNHWLSAYYRQAQTIKTLASALVVSIAVSVCSVAYVCVVNGWFL